MMKYIEDIGHVLIGLVPCWGLVREYEQLPPENDANPVIDVDGTEYWSSVRVMDIFRDLTGYLVGEVFRTLGLVVLLLWALFK